MRAHRSSHRSAAPVSRRRHPTRVYWVRRLLALSVLAAVVLGVVGLGRALTGLSDGRESQDQARATSAEATEPPADGGGPAATTGSPGASASAGSGRGGGAAPKAPSPPPASPEGPCAEEDVLVTPSVKKAVGGRPITIRLDLTTSESEACWWQVSPATLTMRITSGSDEIWTSRECPGAIPERAVAVRQDRRRRIRVEWTARRSDEGCTDRTGWALPGFYHVEAAAYAGEPRDAQFEVTAPEPTVVTRTAEPEKQPAPGPG